MDGNAPATKQDIADLDQKIEQLRAEMKMDMEQLRSEMSHGYRDVAEHLDDIGTKTLTAFCNVAVSPLINVPADSQTPPHPSQPWSPRPASAESQDRGTNR